MRRLLAITLVLIANSAAAQQTPSLAVGVDLGPAFPIGAFADQGAETGWTGNVAATVRLTRVLGVSASYARASFGVGTTAQSGGKDRWTDSGLGAGVRFWYPLREQARLQPWLQLGLGWHRLDPLLAGPAFSSIDTDRILTLEGSAGLEYVLAPRLLLLGPTLRYRSYGFKANTPTATLKTAVKWWSLSAGVAITSGRTR